MRIAIIDEGIQVSKLKYPERVVKQITWENQPFADEVRGRHATCCACILEECASSYELVDIRITDDWKEPVSIKRMTAALELCMTEHIDIICLSIGTTCLSNGRVLNPIIKKLSLLGIKIAASLSNQGYMTLPAACENVICTVQDWKGQLLPGECKIYQHPVLGEVTAANTRLNFLSEYWEGNSFATPVVVGQLLRHPEKIFSVAGEFDKYNCAAANENPVVAYYSANAPGEVCTIMDILREAEELESVAIFEQAGTDDLRMIVHQDNMISRSSMIEAVDKCVDCSLIFSLYNLEDETDDYAYDIEVVSHEKKVVICTEDAGYFELDKNPGWQERLCGTLVQVLS